MGIKYRWYRIKMPPGVDLARLLARKPLSDTASFGFYKLDSDNSEIAFRFVWRTNVTVTRYDEDGEPQHEQIQTFGILHFSLLSIARNAYMRIENPQRNLRDLMNAIESLSGFGFSCSPVTFKQIHPKSIFEYVDESKLVSLRVVGAVLGEDLVARMEFASKKGISLRDIGLLKGHQYKLDVAVFDCVLKGVRGQLSISAGGTIRLRGPLTPRLLHFIQRELPQLSKDADSQS